VEGKKTANMLYDARPSLLMGAPAAAIGDDLQRVRPARTESERERERERDSNRRHAHLVCSAKRFAKRVTVQRGITPRGT
jgi:hypothetical protein